MASEDETTSVVAEREFLASLLTCIEEGSSVPAIVKPKPRRTSAVSSPMPPGRRIFQSAHAGYEMRRADGDANDVAKGVDWASAGELTGQKTRNCRASGAISLSNRRASRPS